MHAELYFVVCLMVAVICFLAYVSWEQRHTWLPARARSEELKKERMGKQI